eukprot:CAMPEP_0117508534 /NCGR_PEP_ID=MMETSP0784-20121206/27001_1 /TAXON_ID=39447 /ORGANISM="" /LENGTH=160 /DNA_ID=CAMNT_0005304097 /DNA_START=163 /DNA_END=646 /DNA_ORIENTATION=-
MSARVAPARRPSQTASLQGNVPCAAPVNVDCVQPLLRLELLYGGLGVVLLLARADAARLAVPCRKHAAEEDDVLWHEEINAATTHLTMRLSVRTESGLGDVTVAAPRAAAFGTAAHVAAAMGLKAPRSGVTAGRLAAAMRPRSMTALFSAKWEKGGKVAV